MAKRAPSGSKAALGYVHDLVELFGTRQVAQSAGVSQRTVQKWNAAAVSGRASDAVHSKSQLHFLLTHIAEAGVTPRTLRRDVRQSEAARRAVVPAPLEGAPRPPPEVAAQLPPGLPPGSVQIAPHHWLTPARDITWVEKGEVKHGHVEPIHVYTDGPAMHADWPQANPVGRYPTEWADVDKWFTIGPVDYFVVLVRFDMEFPVYSIHDTRRPEDRKYRKRGHHPKRSKASKPLG